MKFFDSIFNTGSTSTINPLDFLLCIGVSLLVGVILAGLYMFGTNYTKSFVVTIALMPAVVCAVIMMVNGNIGAGVAVAGAFSLVRFRSAPGSAKEICTIFIAMGAGLISGMGYLAYSVIFAVILGIISSLLDKMNFGRGRMALYKTLKITVPEDLNYEGVFDGILERFTDKYELVKVKTTNMGSLYKLTYDITMKDAALAKDMIDELRVRNGNLEITLSRQETAKSEL